MDDIRRQVLLKFREMLREQPFIRGRRQIILGEMFHLFGEPTPDNDEYIEQSMIRLGNDLAELGMTLCSYPHRPDILCAMEKENAVQPDEAV